MVRYSVPTWRSGRRVVAKRKADEVGRREEGQPELLDDPEFDRRLDARLVEIGRRFGLNQHVGRPLPAAGGPAASTGAPKRGRRRPAG
jgi:hypothetical protein